MLLGIIWSLLAPLSLVLAAALLARVLIRARVRFAVPVSIFAIVAPVATVWFLDWSEFDHICKTEGRAVVYRHGNADGIFLNSGASNSFGMRYLQDEGFSWIEAASMAKPNAWVRYERSSNGTIGTSEIPAVSARYEVREDFNKPNRYIGVSRTRIVERGSGEVLAQAASATFDGGRMGIVLGVWGTRSCPSAWKSPDSFDAFYHLASRTLR